MSREDGKSLPHLAIYHQSHPTHAYTGKQTYQNTQQMLFEKSLVSIGRAYNWKSHAVTMISIHSKFLDMMIDASSLCHAFLHMICSVIHYCH